MFLRRWLNETPVFEEMRQRAALSRELPLRAVLKRHGRAVATSVISTWMLTAAIVVVILMTPFLSSRQAGSDQPIAEFTEIESGKRSENRPQLLAAIELCKAKKAVLVVAKLDRLARNVHFISGPKESKIAFVAVDTCSHPQAADLGT